MTASSVSTVRRIVKEAADLKRSNPFDVAAQFNTVLGQGYPSVKRVRTPSPQPSTSKADFISPRRKAAKRTPSRSEMEDCDSSIIRFIIDSFHLSEGRQCTILQLREKLRQELGYEGSDTSLWRLIIRLGYHWKYMPDNREVLTETNRIRLLRLEYLWVIKKYREDNRPIVYINETYIHTTHASAKVWISQNPKEGPKKALSKGARFIIVRGGTANGFIPNALLIFKSRVRTGDYHCDMNAENFKKWLSEKLIPNLPTHSVVVLDTAYHNVKSRKIPTSASLKSEMISWLTEKGISFENTSTKKDLYNVICRHREQHLEYSIDAVLESHGHSVLRLLPYHPQLNPIEIIWGILKRRVAAKNIEYKESKLLEILNTEFSAITEEEWRNSCRHVQDIEEDYLRKEGIFFNSNRIIINLGEDSDDSDVDAE